MIEDATFWALVALIIFLGAMVYLKVPGMVTSVLDKRADTIRKELDEARRLREEAQDLLASYERKQREAEKDAQALIAHAEAEAERHAKHAAEALEVTLRRRRDLAVERIAQAEKDAVRHVRAAATDLALKATRKLLIDKIDAGKQAELIDGAIADVKDRLH
jgi:F-type H+-transporting ATPase subunit b